MMTRTEALLLRRVNYRDSDLIVTLFTQSLGKVAALARGARRSKTRFSGSLEPIHSLRVELSDSRRGELFQLDAAEIERPRFGLTASLNRLNAAGRALAWVRKAAPERTPEPLIYQVLEGSLDRLDQQPDDDGQRWLAGTGLKLLRAFGWALDFGSCVGCGTPCPETKPAFIQPGRGGVVCRRCGVGGVLVSGASRSRFARVASGEMDQLEPEEAALALRLVDESLSAHADMA